MTLEHVDVDIAIIGGGIAGLWLLNRLCNSGYNAILLEKNTLGSDQTIASQGMIHGGIKYALGGSLTGASEAIADMPDHWRQCLKGKGDVDLRNTKILSDHFYMWSTQSITSKITSFFASKMVRGRVEAVTKHQRPLVFQNDAFKGALYKLVDIVLDVPSLIKNLANNYSEKIFLINWDSSNFEKNDDGSIKKLNINNALSLKAQRFILTAGEGNEELLKLLDCKLPEMQKRPLKQVLVKHQYDYPLYAHCMGSNPSPRLTISSHKTADNKTVWYLGGDLATNNTDASDDVIINLAKKELKELFSWLDFSKAEFKTLFVNRAEPKQKNLLKPDKAFAENVNNCNNLIVGWPTKLTLAPNMTDEIISLLEKDNIHPNTINISIENLILEAPNISQPCWDTIFSDKKNYYA